MELYTIIANLEQTINGKQQLLDLYRSPQSEKIHEPVVRETMIAYLEINIAELKRILEDVKKL